MLLPCQQQSCIVTHQAKLQLPVLTHNLTPPLKLVWQTVHTGRSQAPGNSALPAGQQQHCQAVAGQGAADPLGLQNADILLKSPVMKHVILRTRLGHVVF